MVIRFLWTKNYFRLKKCRITRCRERSENSDMNFYTHSLSEFNGVGAFEHFLLKLLIFEYINQMKLIQRYIKYSVNEMCMILFRPIRSFSTITWMSPPVKSY